MQNDTVVQWSIDFSVAGEADSWQRERGWVGDGINLWSLLLTPRMASIYGKLVCPRMNGEILLMHRQRVLDVTEILGVRPN